jgi:hypothetical protein
MLEVEAVPQSCIPEVQIGLSIVSYMRNLLLVEGFDLCPSNQYVLVRMIPSSFCFAKMYLCEVSLLSRCSQRYWTYSCWRYLTFSSWGNCTLFIWTRAHVSHVLNVTWINLDSLAFILHFLNQIWIASRLVCSFCEAMAGSLSMTTTAVLSAKVGVVDSGEVGRCAVYSSYKNGRRTLQWGMPALTGEGSVYSVSPFTRKCLLCK